MTLPDNQTIATAVQPPAPSATPDEKKAENMVPQSRLNELAEKNRQLQERLEATERERQEQLEKQLQEQGKWKELAEQRATELATLKPKADQVDEYEKTLQDILAAQIEDLPDEFKDVVPDGLSTKAKLDWLAKNKSKFMKVEPFDIGAGKKGAKPDSKKSDLSPEEKEGLKRFGLSEEDYLKHR